jgi:hypothetical protein
VGVVVFCRGFAKNGWVYSGFWWWKRGGWVVKRGGWVASFLALKNAPRFLSLFFEVPVLGNRQPS